MPTRAESGFVPLPKVEREQPEDRIKVALNLPTYLDQDRVGVNLSEIRRLCDWGGIRELRIIGKTDGETSQVIPEVNGINSDGSASASKKMAKVDVPTSTSDMNSFMPKKGSRIAYRWVAARVDVNNNEIAARTAEKPGGAHSVGNWAEELDKGIKLPIRQIGHRNLLTTPESGDKTDYTFLTFIPALYVIQNLAQNSSELILPEALFYCMLIALANKAYGVTLPYNSRFSLTPGFQFDRAAVLSILSRTSTIVGELGKDKK